MPVRSDLPLSCLLLMWELGQNLMVDVHLALISELVVLATSLVSGFPSSEQRRVPMSSNPFLIRQSFILKIRLSSSEMEFDKVF